jgi:hypothetical protein
MTSGISVTVARTASSPQEWFDSTLPLKIFPDFPHDKAMLFRKKYAKGWIIPGGCNYYLAVANGNSILSKIQRMPNDSV